MEWLIPVAIFVASFAFMAVRDRRASRRRRAASAGAGVRFRGRLAVSDGRFRRGTVTVEQSDVQWSTRRSVGLRLTGSEVLATFAPGQIRAARPDDLLVRLRLPDGALAQLLCHEADAGAVVTALRREEAQSDTAPPASVHDEGADRRRPLWALICVVVGGVWLLGWLWLFASGESPTATVAANDGEGYCDVAWTGSNGRQYRTGVDCDDEQPGSRLPIRAIGPPFVGEATDRSWTPGAILVLGLAVTAPGLYRLIRGPRAKAASDALTWDGDVFSSLPPLKVADLEPTDERAAERMARLAPYAARQRLGLTWENPRAPEGSSGRPSWLDLGRAVRWPLFALGLVVLLSAPWPYRWYVLQSSDTRSAVAVSTGEEAISGPGPVPADVTLRFRTFAGEQVTADVATTRDLPEGTEVTIIYAANKPGWARRDDSADGLDRGAGLGAAGGLLTLGWLAARLIKIRRRTRAVAAVLAEPGRPGLALLTSDPAGEPVLLVTDPVVTPARLAVIGLQLPLPLGTSASFPSDQAREVRLHGRLETGAAVAVQLNQSWLLPSYPAFLPDPEDLQLLLDSASLLDEEDAASSDDLGDDVDPMTSTTRPAPDS